MYEWNVSDRPWSCMSGMWLGGPLGTCTPELYCRKCQHLNDTKVWTKPGKRFCYKGPICVRGALQRRNVCFYQSSRKFANIFACAVIEAHKSWMNRSDFLAKIHFCKTNQKCNLHESNENDAIYIIMCAVCASLTWCWLWQTGQRLHHSGSLTDWLRLTSLWQCDRLANAYITLTVWQTD